MIVLSDGVRLALRRTVVVVEKSSSEWSAELLLVECVKSDLCKLIGWSCHIFINYKTQVA